MYLNDYISKSIQDTVGRYVRWGIGMGVIFLITNRVNKQIIPHNKIFGNHVKFSENWKQLFFENVPIINPKVYKILLAGTWGER